jgi:hypothetical protein
VDTAVGSTGHGDVDRFSEDGLERLSDLGGHGPLAGLKRPTGERAAVVLKGELGAQTSSR